MDKPAETIYSFENFQLDSSRKLLLRSPDGEAVSLTHKAFEVLQLLVENSGKLVTKGELMAMVWQDSFVEEANLTQTISVLRRVLGENPNQHRFIVTETGKGYCFVAQVRELNGDKPANQEHFEKKAVAESPPSIIQQLNYRSTYLIAFGSILVFCLIIGAIGWWKYPNQANQSAWLNATATQLTDFAGVEDYPSLSPDRKVLIYSRHVNGKYNIFYQRIGGSNPQNVTADPTVEDWQPAFSPDGEQIAFRSSRSGGGIFVMGATGESIRRLTNFGYNPAWSPDGKEIVFSTVAFVVPIARINDSEIWAVNTSTGETRQIKTGIDAVQPQYSPNGKRLAFWGKDEKYQRDLWTALTDGGDIVRITNDADLDWNPVWSPDGKYLYFCSIRNGGTSLWSIAVDEESGKPLGEPEAIVGPPAQSRFVTISRDGKSIVYVRGQPIGNVQRIEFDSMKMRTVGKPLAITDGTKHVRTADVSPDSKQVVFYLTGETQEDLVTVNTDDLRWNQLTNDMARDRVPRFSPDGSRIAFYSNLTGVYEIWTIKPDGSDRQQITNHSGSGFLYPIWSPDGSHIAFSGFGSGSKIIENGKPWEEQTPVELPPLNEKGDWFIAWSWSPDGKKLIGWRGDQRKDEYDDIYVYSFETNSYEKITDNCFRPVWLADSRHFIATQDDKLFVFDAQTKTGREILSLLPEIIDSPAVTPDNRNIFFGLRTVESDIQMLSIK